MEEAGAAGLVNALLSLLLLIAVPHLEVAHREVRHEAVRAEVVVHDVHVTQSRVVVENGTVLWRVRCFSDDLEKALRAHTKRADFVLATDARADSVVSAYFNARVQVTADGRRLTGRMVGGGREKDPVGGDVNWYVLQLDAGKQPKQLSVRQGMLTELFPTQQNLVVLLASPGDTRRSMYFAAGDDAAQTVKF